MAGASFKLDLSGLSNAVAKLGNLANQILTAAQGVVDVALKILNDVYEVVVEVQSVIEK